MKRVKKIFSLVVASLLTVFTLISYLPVRTASAAVVVPKVQFASAPVTQYKAGDRVNFNINAPNYGGRVQYRVVLWNDSKKTYYDLWNDSNGYPERYYTKWQPYGNNIFTLGWIISEPGSYRITVYVKRAGIPNSKTALKGYNCDSYMESVAFYVKSKEVAVESILQLSDVTVMQGATPTLPTKVKATMSDGTQKDLGVTWPSVNTTNTGTQTIEGTVQETTKKASLRINVTAQTAINVDSVVSTSNTLVNVSLRDAIYSTPEVSKFSIKTYNSSTTIPIYTANLSSDKKTVTLSTAYMTTSSWYTLTVNNNSYNFISNQGIGSGISISALNKEVAVNGTVNATVTKYPSDVTLTYSSSNTNIATVNQTTGLITGKYPGIATITVYGNKYGYNQVTTTFTVTVGGQSGVYVYAENMNIGVGTQQYPNITKNPSDLTLSFSSNRTNIATVDQYSGLIRGISQGVATITIAATRYGYSTIYFTFTVTVGNQGIAISANPTRLREAQINNGSLESGVIEVTLTGSTFYNWGYSYYENYVDVDNLPYGMSYTVSYVNSNKLRVTITGRASSHRHIDSKNINIIVDKEMVNGSNYNLSTENVLLDFVDYPTPAAPTNPNVDDVNDTFGWTNVPGYDEVSDYEYSIDDGAHWTDCTARPQKVGNYNLPIGTVQVRVAAANGTGEGDVLESHKAFTKTNDNSAPKLKATMEMKYKGDNSSYVYSLGSNNVYQVRLDNAKEVTDMIITATDENLDKNNVAIKNVKTQAIWGTLRHTQNGVWTLNTATPIPVRDSITLIALFKDLAGNTTTATIEISVGAIISNIPDLSQQVERGKEYNMPEKVKAKMSDGTEMDLNVVWDRTIPTYAAGFFTALGTVQGYTPKVILTVAVIPPAPTGSVVDDYNNTFGWTNVPGYSNIADYEYSVDDGTTWADCTVNPQPVGDENYASEHVQVRVKGILTPAGRPTGYPLKSDKPYTKGTPVDDKAPGLANMIMTFKDGSKTFLFQNGKTALSLPVNTELKAMTILVEDDNLDKKDVTIYQHNALGDLEKIWGTLKYNTSKGLYELAILNPIVFSTERDMILRMVFQDMNKLITPAEVKVNVYLPIKNIPDIDMTVDQNTAFTMPEKVKALMQDDTNREFDIDWEGEPIGTSIPGTFVAYGKVAGYDPKVKLTVTVNKVFIRIINRTQAEIRQERNGTGGIKLKFAFATQKLNITGSGVPWYPAEANGNPPYAGNWVGVEIDRPAQAVDAAYFYYKGEKLNFDYTDGAKGFWFYFTVDKTPVTLDIQWGENYLETITIQCTATVLPNPNK